MKNETNLVILIPGFAKDESDTACLPAQQDFVRTINRLYPQVKLHVLAFQYPFQKKEYEWYGNKVIAFGGNNKGGISRRLLWWRVARILDQLKKQNTISGLFSFWAGECGYVGKKWAKKNGLPHFALVMGQDAKKGNKYISKKGLEGEDLFAISDFTADELKRNYSLTCRAITPTGVELPLRTELPRSIDIICAGSLIPLKQYDIAIEVVKNLREQFPNIKMMVCGEGPERERLTGLIRQYDLDRNIVLAGEKQHPELLSLMQQSKIFLHPSSYEGLGVSCLEALSVGLPVVAFQKAMREPIEKWYVVNSNDTMKDKLVELLRSHPGFEPVIPYTMEDTVKKVLGFFSQAADRYD